MLFPHFHGLYVSNYVYFVARCTPYIFLCVSSPGALPCQAHVQQIIDQARISTKDEVKPSVGELKDAYTLIRSSYDLWLLPKKLSWLLDTMIGATDWSPAACLPQLLQGGCLGQFVIHRAPSWQVVTAEVL